MKKKAFTSAELIVIIALGVLFLVAIIIIVSRGTLNPWNELKKILGIG